jgi:hypothetical protein
MSNDDNRLASEGYEALRRMFDPEGPRRALIRIGEEERERKRAASPEWAAIEAAYLAVLEDHPNDRPKQLAVAGKLGYSTEQPLRDRLRSLGIDNWRKVHPLIRRWR